MDFNVPPEELEVFRGWASPLDTLMRVERATHAFTEVFDNDYSSAVSEAVLGRIFEWLETHR